MQEQGQEQELGSTFTLLCQIPIAKAFNKGLGADAEEARSSSTRYIP